MKALITIIVLCGLAGCASTSDLWLVAGAVEVIRTVKP